MCKFNANIEYVKISQYYRSISEEGTFLGGIDQLFEMTDTNSSRVTVLLKTLCQVKTKQTNNWDGGSIQFLSIEASSKYNVLVEHHATGVPLVSKLLYIFGSLFEVVSIQLGDIFTI